MKLKENMMKLLKEKQMSLSLLAKKSGVPKSTLFSWEKKSQDTVSLTQLKKVATVLEVSVHELAFGSEDPFQLQSDEMLKEIFKGDIRVSISRIERRWKG